MGNKHVVERYIEAFNATNHAAVLATLTDDVVWDTPGFFRREGKAAFDQEIEDPDADGDPVITITRLVEEGDVVVAEGSVTARMKDGQALEAAFCDVFHFREGLICKLTSYLAFLQQPSP